MQSWCPVDSARGLRLPLAVLPWPFQMVKEVQPLADRLALNHMCNSWQPSLRRGANSFYRRMSQRVNLAVNSNKKSGYQYT